MIKTILIDLMESNQRLHFTAGRLNNILQDRVLEPRQYETIAKKARHVYQLQFELTVKILACAEYLAANEPEALKEECKIGDGPRLPLYSHIYWYYVNKADVVLGESFANYVTRS